MLPFRFGPQHYQNVVIKPRRLRLGEPGEKAAQALKPTANNHAPRRRNYFSDLVGWLENLRVTCGKCGRAGQYRLDRLIAKHGRDAKIPDWLAKISADCPKRQNASISDRCAVHCPDLLPVYVASTG